MRVNVDFIKKISLLAVCSALLICSADVYAKDITRSCRGYYYGSVLSIEPKNSYRTSKVGIPLDTINIGFSDRTFSAEAGCGELVPNRCRERAREELLSCAKAHVSAPNQKPVACGGNDPNKYPITDLFAMIKEKACGQLTTKDAVRISDLFPKDYTLSVLVGIFIDGDDNCGKKDPGITTVDGHKFHITGNKLFLREPLKIISVNCP